MKPARIQDVAQLAGVSWKTVSNVLHDHPHVRPETRARVEAAIAELHYRPSLVGRQLRSGRTQLLALAVPEIHAPYFGELAHAIIAAASTHGYTVLIDETHGSPEHEAVVAEGFSVRLIDGIIFSPLGMDTASLSARRDRTPMVLLGEHIADSGLDLVGIDNVAAAREATAHLLDGGRRHIAFLGAQPQGPYGTGDLRLAGYRAELADRALAPIVVEATEYTRVEGAQRVRHLLRELGVGPRSGSGGSGDGTADVALDAIVCANDVLAFGAMYALREAGVSVPADVAVVGWDDVAESAYCNPALSTIAPDKGHLAEVAVQALVERIGGKDHPPVTHVVPHRLIVRESSAPRPGRTLSGPPARRPVRPPGR